MLKLVLSVALLATLGDAANLRTWTSRIVGGENALVNEWPWQISLQVSENHICGGSLIDATHVLTAAHCMVYSISWYTVVVGAYSLKTDEKTQSRSLSNITIHSGFQNNGNLGFPNDIAVLTLSSAVNMADNVKSVTLPSEGANFEGKECYITGWGRTSGTASNSLPDILQKAEMDVITNGACRSAWSSIRDSHICVDTSGKSACMGDSGGPLVCKVDGNWILAGITSWGHYQCHPNGYPSVYTRVSSYLPWINGNM